MILPEVQIVTYLLVKMFYKKQGFKSAIYTVCLGIIMLVMYLLPIFKVLIKTDPIFPLVEDMYINVNLYKLLGVIFEIGMLLQ